MVRNKKYTIHTVGQIISFYSFVPPEYTEDKRVIFIKPSGDEICFERSNIICIDEVTMSDNSEKVTTD